MQVCFVYNIYNLNSMAIAVENVRPQRKLAKRPFSYLAPKIWNNPLTFDFPIPSQPLNAVLLI